MNIQTESGRDLSNDPFAITVCGVYSFPEEEWRAAIRRFLKEMRSDSGAAQSDPSIRFGTVTLKLDRTTERYYAWGPNPETPKEKTVRACSETDGKIVVAGNDQKMVENALSHMIDGDVFMKLFLHFDMSRSDGQHDMHSRKFPVLYLWKLESLVEYTVNVNSLPSEDPMLERSVA